MNPLDWTGPEFLKLYILLLPASYAVALLLRYLLRSPSGAPQWLGRRVDPYDVAALGGPDKLIEAVVVSLFHRGALRVESQGIVAAQELSADASPIERSVYESASTTKATMNDLRRALKPHIARYQKRLMAQGLVVDNEQAANTLFISMAVPCAVLLLGVAKIFVGLSRGKPIELLLILVFLGGIGLIFLGRRPWRSLRGSATLKALKSQHEALRFTAMSSTASESLSASDLALAVSLYGPGLLMGLGYADIRQVIDPPNTGSGGGDSGGCGGGGCGGGGCGGCGS